MNSSFRVVIKADALKHLTETSKRNNLTFLEVIRIGLKLARECLNALRKGHRVVILTKEGKAVKEFFLPTKPLK